MAQRPPATGRRWGLSDRPEWSRRLLAILGGASLAVVFGLWAGNHGLTDLASPGSAATSLGRVTGLIAADQPAAQLRAHSSGATVTSDGYRQSLQSALDTAHFTG